ncbi:MAG: hypothetical protein RLZZ141_543 [Pseudomonadota bacterium]
MQTDYAQILPIILPAQKAGAGGHDAVAKGVALQNQSAAIEADLAEGDEAERLDAFDQALAQMMMVQMPAQAVATAPKAAAQQALTAGPDS